MHDVSKPQVRLARLDDLNEITTFIAGSFAPFRDVLAGHIFEPYVKDSCDLAGRWAEGIVAVLEGEGRLLGTITYYPDAVREGMGWPYGFAGLRTLAVASSAQGRGYGRMLCEWCVMRAREEKAKGVALHTAAFMRRACKLYESLGFQRQPAHDLRASEVLGFDPARGDQEIIAYVLPLPRRPRMQAVKESL